MNTMRIHAAHDRPPTLSIRDLSIVFSKRRTENRVVKGVSIDVWPGEIVGVIGESGSGKTLTALSALRMLPKHGKIASGQIHLGTTDLRTLSDAQMRSLRGDRMAFIPQDALQALNPTMRVGRQVGEPLELHRSFTLTAAKDAAISLLKSVHVHDAESRAAAFPHQFSGGMQQRAMIAMALALDPELIIADEPTTALDVTVQAQVLKLIKEIRDKHRTSVLFITHDLGVVAQLCDWVYVMQDGVVVEDGAVREIFTRPQQAYTRMLLAATPSLRSPRLAGGAA